MKITLDIDEELQGALECHLKTGIAMQVYVKAALAFFTALYRVEQEGKYAIGYGDVKRFDQYNIAYSPNVMLMDKLNREPSKLNAIND